MSATAPHHRPLVLAAGSLLDIAPLELIEVAAAAGFDGVGLRLGSDDLADPAAVSALARAAARESIMIHDVEVVRIPAGELAPDGLPEGAAELIAAAGALDEASVLVVSDHGDVDHTAAVLERLVRRARRHEVTIGLEYMAWTTPSDPLGALEMARRTGCRVVVDVLHHHRVGAGIDSFAALVDAKVLGWVQICDVDLALAAPGDHGGLIREARHGRLIPGTGSVDLAAFVSHLPPGVPVSVEVQSDTLLAVAPAERAVLLYTAARAVLSA